MNHNHVTISTLKKISNLNRVVFSFFISFCFLNAHLFAETKIINYQMPEAKPISSKVKSRQEFVDSLTLRYKLVKLWPFDNAATLTDEFIQGVYQVPAKKYNISQNYACKKNTFVRFGEASSLIVDETDTLSDFFNSNKPSTLEAQSYFLKKIRVKAAENFPNVVPKTNPDFNRSIDRELIHRNDKQINYSSSLVRTKYINQKESQIVGTNYTIGGWFKSERPKLSQSGNVSLLRKKFLNQNGSLAKTEWELFLLGDQLYFHNYRDYSQPVALKYMTDDQANEFRYKNQNFYGSDDYYEDVVANATKINLNQPTLKPNSNLVSLVNNLNEAPIVPTTKRNLHNKPITPIQPYPQPIPQPFPPNGPGTNPNYPAPPSPYPVTPPGYVPFPIHEIPRPSLPPIPIFISPGNSGKEHTLSLGGFYPHMGYCENCFPQYDSNYGIPNNYKIAEKTTDQRTAQTINTSSNLRVNQRLDLRADQRVQRAYQHSEQSKTLTNILSSVPAAVQSTDHRAEQDIWQYIAISFHYNDPLGPYLDVYIIQDPNPVLTKTPVNFKQRAQHLRIPIKELNVASLPMLNPFENGIDIELDCFKNDYSNFSKGSCLRSTLEFGSLDAERPFVGSMRGVFIAKDALPEDKILDLAYEYYPEDKELCTYEKK